MSLDLRRRIFDELDSLVLIDPPFEAKGEFADVGATVNAWLGGKSPRRGIPGTPIVER